MRDIPVNEELLVWYGADYAKDLGLPATTRPRATSYKSAEQVLSETGQVQQREGQLSQKLLVRFE